MRFSTILLAMAGTAVMAQGASLGFNACPNVGADVFGCQLLISVTAVDSLGVGTAFFVTQNLSGSFGPYDGSDDTLVGIQNNDPNPLHTLLSITLTSTAPIAAFEGDGACIGTYVPGPTAAQCLGGIFHTSSPLDYESAGVTFSNFSSLTSVTVNFSPGLAPNVGGSCGGAWFSLEESLTPGSFNGGPPGTTCNSPLSSTPEPDSAMLLGFGLTGLGLFFLVLKRRVVL